MACAPIPACDPGSSQYDPSQCAAYTANLTCIFAYGSLDYCQSLPPANTCAPDLVCRAPECLWLEENGSFEADSANTHALQWAGDASAIATDPACDRTQSLDFIATTPDGASPSTSAQIYQVIDLAARVPEAQRNVMQRLRARASFTIQDLDATDDRQFGIRLDAYAGDPSAFPRTGDPATIPAQTSLYERLASATDTFVYDATGEVWQAATVELALPEAADFVVVLLEHDEDVQNDTDVAEFEGHSVDQVQVALDGGNAPPIAVPDAWSVDEDATATLDVLTNDADATSRIDGASLAIATPPANGTATLLLPGRVRYTPAPDFNGADVFTYTVADEEGLISNEALVTLTVRPVNDPPVAQDDLYAIPVGDTLSVTANLGVLANDTDIDGDALTAVLRLADPEISTIDLDPSGAFTVTVPDAFEGVTAFTYRAHDADTTSGITLVTLTRGDTEVPTVLRTIPDRTLTAGGAEFYVNLDTVFADPIGDGLTYSRTLAPGAAAHVDAPLTGSILRIIPQAPGGPFDVTVRAENAAGAAEDVFAVTVTGSGNQPPVAVDDSVSTPEDTPVIINVVANDFDPDGDVFQLLTIRTPPVSGTVETVVQDGVTQVRYTPGTGFTGTDTFGYDLFDAPFGNTSNEATVAVTVLPSADA